MSKVQWTVSAALVSGLILATAVLLENRTIADPDLRYPIVLLTKLAGIILVVLFVGRAALLVIKGKVLAVAPRAEAGLQNLGTVLFLTAASLMGCVFGASLMRAKSGGIEYWPLPIVLAFGGLGVLCTRYLWREWRVFRGLSRKG